MHMADKESQLVSLHSEWVGESYLRVRVRRVAKLDKLIVDVWEMVDSRHRTSMARARKVAREAARKASVGDASSMCLLLDFETDRKTSRFDGSQSLLRIRQTSFAF